jgi:hypothetical protein
MTHSEQDQASSLVPPFQIPLAVVSKQRFAELTGLSLGVVEGHLDRGFLPSLKIGKHRMVNLAKLWVMALADEGEG